MKRIIGISIFILFGTIVISVSGQVLLAEDPTWISPQLYTVRFENDQVRVLEFHIQPGEKNPMHSHPARVIYHLSDGAVRQTLPNGTISEGVFTKGFVQWADAMTHATENIGATETHALAIEIK